MFAAAGFWGRAWYDRLERNCPDPALLGRARRHVERGALTDLRVRRRALVASLAVAERYAVEVEFRPLFRDGWNALREACARRRWFRWELVQGTPEAFRTIVLGSGLFPSPGNMSFRCACLNRRSRICEHALAALYGVGTRLDASPGTLFELRGVDFGRLATGDIEGLPQAAAGDALDLDADGLGELFGVAVEPEPAPDPGLAALDAPAAAGERKPVRPARTLFDGG